MRRIRLGKTNIWVSSIAFGTLTLGPFQCNFSIKKGANLIVKAVREGINLIDTAKIYDTYSYIKEALSILSEKEKKDLHIISRSYDYTYTDMERSVFEALESMGLDKISIFMLHEVDSIHQLKGHWDAVRSLVDLKKRGVIGAVGLSTHYISGVKAALNTEEIDIVFAILNCEGLGIRDGSAEEMVEVLWQAHQKGKGILIMKALGGGHLYEKWDVALNYIKNLPFPCSVVIGMQSYEEIKCNLSAFDEKKMCGSTPTKERKLFIEEPWCVGCGECVKACPFDALKLVDGKAKVMDDKCLLCSYCARACPLFCIKVV